MKIQNKDIYYGIALTQIVEYPTFTSINKISGKDGLFLINDYKRILIKYSTSEDDKWRFTFIKDDLITTLFYEKYYVLVCGLQAVCILTYDDVAEILKIDSEKSQWVNVELSGKGRMRVWGAFGELSHKVSNSDFPQNIFGDGRHEEEYLWPPLSRINLYYNEPNLIYSSTERTLDLADDLAYNVDEDYSRTVIFGLSTLSSLWTKWDDLNLEKIEERIRYQFEFDGYEVDIERITEDYELPGHKEFLWRLHISLSLEDEEVEEMG